MKRLQVVYNDDAISINSDNELEIRISDEQNNALSYDIDGSIIVDTSMVAQQEEDISSNYFNGIDVMGFMNDLPFSNLGVTYGTDPNWKNTREWCIPAAGNGMLIDEMSMLNRIRSTKDDTSEFDPIPGRHKYTETDYFTDVLNEENEWPIYTDPYIKNFDKLTPEDPSYVPDKDVVKYFTNVWQYYNTFTMTYGMDSTVSRHTEYNGSNIIVKNNDGPVMCKCVRSEGSGLTLDDSYEDSILYGILANADQQDNTVVTLLPKTIYEGE